MAEAKEFCSKTLGADLMVIDTEEEQNLFTKQLQLSGKDKVWIDLKRTGKLCTIHV